MLFLPELLLKNRTISFLKYEENKIEPYNDNLGLFPALALPLHGNQRPEEETSKFFNSFKKRMDGLRPNQFNGVHMNDIPIVEDLLTLNILLSHLHIVEGNIFGDLANRSVQKYKNAVRLLRCNNHQRYITNINGVFQFLRFSNCDTFFK